jgi:hypothetical protein
MDGFTSTMVDKLPLAVSVFQMLAFVLEDAFLEDLYERKRGRGYTLKIGFPLLVSLVNNALTRHDGSGTASFQQGQQEDRLDASVRAAQRKLSRVALAVSTGLVEESATRLMAIVPEKREHPLPASLQEFTAIVVDGKVVKRVPKRLKPLRNVAGGVLGGRALVAFEYQRGLAIAMEATEDGDANDVRFIPTLVANVRRSRTDLLWIADRQFGLLAPLATFAQEGGRFLVRATKAVPFFSDETKAAQTGRDQTDRPYVQEWGWLGMPSSKNRIYVRRITVQREGAEAIALVTNLLDEQKYCALDLLETYRNRVNIEYMFQRITEVFGLGRLIGTSPRATVFQLAYCMVLYNVVQVVRTTIAAANDKEVEDVSPQKLFADVCDELKSWFKLMDWRTTVQLFGKALASEDLRDELAKRLCTWQKRWQKAKRRSNRPPRPKGKRGHQSAFRVLNKAKGATS